MAARHVVRRSLVLARLILVALLANVGLGAICDAMCAAPAPARQLVSVRAVADRTPMVTSHAGHCQTPAPTGTRAAAGHRVAFCQHEAEPSTRLPEARGPMRVDTALAALPGSLATHTVSSATRLASRGAGPPTASRAQRPLVLRI